MAKVTIGPEFFKKSKNDYADWMTAWIREILQNSMDSGGDEIQIDFESTAATELRAKVSNNGRCMDRDVLVNKLFSLGSSGKDFKAGAIGGFGKAKELLYFAQKDYVILTNNLRVEGCGGVYDIIENSNSVQGTISIVNLSCEHEYYARLDGWLQRATQLISQSAYLGKITLNKKVITERSNKGAEVRTFKGGVCYFNCNTDKINQIIYRVKGAPMFSRQIKNLGKGLIIEINDPCHEYLASNRDGLLWSASVEIDEFISELTIDKTSALIKKQTYIHMYTGKRGRLCKPRPKPKPKTFDFSRSGSPINIAEINLYQREQITVMQDREDRAIELSEGLVSRVHGQEIKTKVTFQEALLDYNFLCFFAKAEPLPSKWVVGTFCDNAEWVAWAWSVAIWDIFLMSEKEPDFDFGFVFDDSCEAKYTSSAFLINPCHTDYKIKYTKTRQDACKLLTIAAHEYVHHKGYGCHDENFASAYTDLMVKVMINAPRTITRMLDKKAQAALDYNDFESRVTLSRIETKEKSAQ